jgi:DNA-binding LytR/AlgR family response regulator
MDIQLSDGTAFDLLKQVVLPCPIIFTTAYDQYAVEAFKTSSIDYLLKPVKKDDLSQAMHKLEALKIMLADENDKNQHATYPIEYRKRFLLRFGDHIKALIVSDIAYCYSENKSTFARTFDGKNYLLDHNLDALETMLDPKEFFRINRQYLICFKSIDDMRSHTKARVIVKLKPAVNDQPVVSSERAADFKNWITGDSRATLP